MKLTVLIVGVEEATWFKGTRDERKVKQLNCLDTDKFCQCKETFDYTPNQDEVAALNLEELLMSEITLGVSTFQKENGRLKASRGKIDLATVPAKARKTTETAPARDNGKTVLGMSGSPKVAA